MRESDWIELDKYLTQFWSSCFFKVEGVLPLTMMNILEAKGHKVYNWQNIRGNGRKEKWFLRAACGEEWRIEVHLLRGAFEFRCAPWVREKREREERRNRENAEE